MAAVSQSISNLLGGVSQQPDPIKLPGQVREAVNAYLDPTFGCKKRPPTIFTSLLSAADIPPTAKWFPIIRDTQEKYIVCIYRSSGLLNVRVWDAVTGTERTVIVSSTAREYFNFSNPDSLNWLTLADYTLISNGERTVTMNRDTSPGVPKEAFVTVNAVAYNTNYSIDLNKDGDEVSTVQVFSAAGLEVEPGSYEVADGGTCGQQSAQDHTVSSGAKTGLTFRITNTCSSFLRKITTTRAKKVATNGNFSGYSTSGSGDPANFIDGPWPPAGVYAVSRSGVASMNVRVFYRQIATTKITTTTQFQGFFLSSRTSRTVPVYGMFMEYVSGGDGWNKGDTFPLPAPYNRFSGYVTERSVNESEQYFSRYNVSIELKNGGTGWRVGDTVQVSQGGVTYTVRVSRESFVYTFASDGTASYVTPLDAGAGQLSISNILAQLQVAVNAISGYTSTATGNVLRIRRTDSRDFSVSVRGGPTNQAMTCFKGQVNDFSELPSQCFPGTVVKVNNTEDTDSDNYWVKFVASSNGIPGSGSWEECPAPGIELNMNPSTLPHALIRNADGTFSLSTINSSSALGGWASREVGDDTTNPLPTFIGKRISNMFFYRNRLGFLCEDAVIMSQPGEYFNFFVNSAITVSDSDPIDITASSAKPAILQETVETPKGLVLFSEHSQFLLNTDEISFSPNTVKMTETANYGYRSVAKPVTTGVSIMFPTEADAYTKVFEMATESVDQRPVVAEITRIVPEYIPTGLKWSATSPNNSILMLGNDSPDVYVFKYFNTGNERQLAGWSKWTFPGEVKLIACDQDTNYVVLYGDGRYTLCSMELVDNPDESPIETSFSKFTPRLDLIVQKSAVVTVDNGDGTSKVRYPTGSYYSGRKTYLIVTNGESAGTYINQVVEFDGTGAFMTVPTNLLVDDYVIGLGYDFIVELPSFYVTQDQRPDRIDNPVVELLYLDLYYSGRYEIEVERLGYDPYRFDVEVRQVDLYIGDSIPVEEVFTKECPIYFPGKDVKVTVEAEDPMPAAITGYSWRGHYNKRGVAALR